MSFGDPNWRKWVLPKEDGIKIIRRALELGINFFDTADVYSLGVSEEILGIALKGIDRSSVVVATKVFFPLGNGPNDKGLSRKHIMDSIEKSLTRLQMDYVDLYQIHRWDYETPIEETMEALHDLVKSGKVRYIGASSMFTWQFAKAQFIAEKRGWTKFISMQNHYNLVYREEEREMIPFCVDQGVGIIPWSPLARGFLCGTRTKVQENEILKTTRQMNDPLADSLYFREEDWIILDCVKELAKIKGVSPAKISLAWMFHKNAIAAPIIGVTKIEHLEEAVAATQIKLTPDEIQILEQDYKPHPVMGIK